MFKVVHTPVGDMYLDFYILYFTFYFPVLRVMCHFLSSNYWHGVVRSMLIYKHWCSTSCDSHTGLISLNLFRFLIQFLYFLLLFTTVSLFCLYLFTYFSLNLTLLSLSPFSCGSPFCFHSLTDFSSLFNIFSYFILQIFLSVNSIIVF